MLTVYWSVIICEMYFAHACKIRHILYDCMIMRFIVYGALLLSPVILLNYLVMPELDTMKYFYSHIDATASNVAGVNGSDNSISKSSTPIQGYQSTLTR